ncbi:hypothetical protein BJ912DRAFT_994724 [Pholiota molesta]|nr:hypothetical protein BJ912DRAFT_994724 [Pholiota molesta]
MNATAPPTALPLGVDVHCCRWLILGYGVHLSFIASTLLDIGVIVSTAWMYVNDNKDGWPYKPFGLDIATTALNSHFIHAYFIANFGNLENLALINKSILLEYTIAIIVIFLVQLFFASRVYILNGQGYILPGIIIITACLSFGAGIYTIAKEFKVPLVSALASRSIRVRVFCDVAATIALSWNLAQAQRQSRVKNHHFAFGVMYLVHPDNLYWMPLHLMLSKLYVITMIAILNSRSWISNSLESTVDLPAMFSTSIGITTTPRIATSDAQAFELKKFPDSYNGVDTQNGKGIYASQPAKVV